MIHTRRLAVLAEGKLDFHSAKTAVSVVRYRPHEVVAIIDSKNVGRSTAEVLNVGDVPIVETLGSAMKYSPSALLIGIAPRGGGLPPEWRAQILDAIARGLDVISGLHFMLNDDPEFASAADGAGVRLHDVRKPPPELDVASMAAHRDGSHVVTFVGSDCAVGKMTAALEITSAARERGMSAAFVATGQTGIMLEGNGIAIDRVIGDFMAGATEQLVVDACRHADWVFVEGQGSLLHPAYSGVTLSLLHGSAPDSMILVHQSGQHYVDVYSIEIPPLDRLVKIYEEAAGWVKPAKVIGLSLTTRDMDERAAHAAIESAENITGLPATDPVRFGAAKLVDAVRHAKQKQVPFHAFG